MSIPGPPPDLHRERVDTPMGMSHVVRCTFSCRLTPSLSKRFLPMGGVGANGSGPGRLMARAFMDAVSTGTSEQNTMMLFILLPIIQGWPNPSANDSKYALPIHQCLNMYRLVFLVRAGGRGGTSSTREIKCVNRRNRSSVRNHCIDFSRYFRMLTRDVVLLFRIGGKVIQFQR